MAGDLVFFPPGSGTPASIDIDTTSNVGVLGLYVYRVDQEVIIQPSSNYIGKYLAYTNQYIIYFYNKLFKSRNS